MNGQPSTPSLASDPDYKNLLKYLEQAQAYADKGDSNNATKRLSYAQKFSEKLIKKGLETEIADQLQTMKALAEQGGSTINNYTTTPTNQQVASMSTTEFRNAMRDLTDLSRQLDRLMQIDPAGGNLQTYQNPVIESFDPKKSKEEIQYLLGTDAATKPQNKSQVKVLQNLSEMMEDWGATMKGKGIHDRIMQAVRIAESDPNRAGYVYANTLRYIDLLLPLDPQNVFLIQQQKRIQQLKQTHAKQQAAAKVRRPPPASQVVSELPVGRDAGCTTRT